MNVYLLPHHRLDPRFRYTLEREATRGPRPSSDDQLGERGGLVRRWWRRTREMFRRLRHDYDHMVHGHEQIRLSKLLLLMDRDPSLTLVIPAGMSREAALEAIRGVIRAGLMAHRSYVVRNVSTVVFLFIILLIILPLHFTAFLFLPLLILYAWLRYWEDRLIRRTMQHLLGERLPADSNERFREEVHLARLEELFGRTVRPDLAYKAAVEYLDGLDDRVDGYAAPEHALLFNYYSDMGQLDPYERYQDRIRKRLIESIKLAWQHISGMIKSGFRWMFERTRVAGVRLPNWVFVVCVLGVLVSAAWGAVLVWSKKLDSVVTPPQSAAHTTLDRTAER